MYMHLEIPVNWTAEYSDLELTILAGRSRHRAMCHEEAGEIALAVGETIRTRVLLEEIRRRAELATIHAVDPWYVEGVA